MVSATAALTNPGRTSSWQHAPSRRNICVCALMVLKGFCRRSSSTMAAIAVTAQVGWICQTIVLFGLPYTPSYYFNPNHVAKGFFWVFACLPWCPLVKSTSDFGSATNSEKDPGKQQCYFVRKGWCRYMGLACLVLHHQMTNFIQGTRCADHRHAHAH